MPKWDTLDLTPLENELDKILDDWIEKHPEIDIAVATTVFINILIIILRDCPTFYRTIAVDCIQNNYKMKLERDREKDN
jgi:hypothetical protein